MSNQLPFYLWKRLEGEREHDRFGDRIVTGDINGDGYDEWIISASTATYIEDEDGVNPLPHYYKGKVYVYTHDLQLLFTLNGNKYGDCFGTSLALADLNGDGIQEIIVGAPRVSSASWIECGEVSVFSGQSGERLFQWTGEEDYARLGTALATLDWNHDGFLDLAVSSHSIDPNGLNRNGRVTIFSGHDRTIIEQIKGQEQEGLGLSLVVGDVDGDGRDELIIGAPRYSSQGLIRQGRVLVYSKERGLLYESRGERAYDEFGHIVTTSDMDGDGVVDLIIGTPKASGEYARGGLITVFSIARNKLILEKEGWFGQQELGTDLTTFLDSRGQPHLIAGSKVGAAYLLDTKGKLVHEFNGDESEVFGQSLSSISMEGEQCIAIGAVSGMNKNHFMSGCVYFITSNPPLEAKKEEPAVIQPSIPSLGSPSTTKMKILLATYWYLPHVGGVDVYVRLLKEELERRGHHVDVLAHHPDMAHYYLVDGDKKINKWKIKSVVDDKVFRFYQRYLSHVDPWVRYREIERYCFEMAAVLFDLGQYDVIHTQDIVSTRALSRVKPASTALVATIHGLLAKEHIFSKHIESKESLAWKYVADEEYYGCTSADATIVPTEWLVEEMTQFAVPSEIFNVIPYGLDINEFDEKTRKPMLDPFEKKGTFTISCPARLVPVKGHRILIGALRRIAPDMGWHCYLLGDGPLRAEITQLIQDAGLTERITLLGDRSDVPALLQQSDVMVLPSLQDNLPFSIMEAQLAGTPIVASNAGGIPEMIKHEQTGLLFESGNEEQLADQITRMMNDSELRSSISQQATDWATNQWSSVTLMERTLSVYEQALERVRGS